MSARWRPKTFSSASDTSPTVARRRTALIERSSRLPDFASAASVNACSAAATAALSRAALTWFRRAICDSRTDTLSISRISTLSSVASLYLLTPTITSLPESMRACFSAAAASIFSLAQPEATARVMPPMDSTSSISVQAASAICCVSDSIM